MHTDTQKKKPTESANYSAGHTDKQILTSGPDIDKTFATWVARFALAGHTLTRCTSPDAAMMYYVGLCGMSRALPDLRAAARVLEQIGGAA